MIEGLSAIEKLEDTRRAKETMLLFKMYPKSIPYFPVRIDPMSHNHNEPVSRGRLELLDKSKKVPLKQFKEVLQCDDSEPALDQYYGTLSLMLLFPPSKESVELMCAWAETRCNDWVQCKAQVDKFKRGMHCTFPIFIIYICMCMYV